MPICACAAHPLLPRPWWASKVQCFRCNQFGHLERECVNKRRPPGAGAGGRAGPAPAGAGAAGAPSQGGAGSATDTGGAGAGTGVVAGAVAGAGAGAGVGAVAGAGAGASLPVPRGVALVQASGGAKVVPRSKPLMPIEVRVRLQALVAGAGPKGRTLPDLVEVYRIKFDVSVRACVVL